MSGGEAYVFDESGEFESICNKGLVSLEEVSEEKDLNDLKRLIELHKKHTGSKNATRILSNWDSMIKKFVKVMPNDYKRILAEREINQNIETVNANG